MGVKYTRDDVLEKLDAYHAEVLSTNWADYLNLVYNVPFWEAELEKLTSIVQPYLHEPAVGAKFAGPLERACGAGHARFRSHGHGLQRGREGGEHGRERPEVRGGLREDLGGASHLQAEDRADDRPRPRRPAPEAQVQVRQHAPLLLLSSGPGRSERSPVE